MLGQQLHCRLWAGGQLSDHLLGLRLVLLSNCPIYQIMSDNSIIFTARISAASITRYLIFTFTYQATSRAKLVLTCLKTSGRTLCLEYLEVILMLRTTIQPPSASSNHQRASTAIQLQDHFCLATTCLIGGLSDAESGLSSYWLFLAMVV